MNELRYEYPAVTLQTGASLGNEYAFARLDEETNLRGLWSSSDNEYYAGDWEVSFESGGKPLDAEETILEPACQSTLFSCDGLRVEKVFFIPFTRWDAEPREMRMAVYLVRAFNESEKAADLVIRHMIRFPAGPSGKFTKQPPPDQAEKRVVVHEAGARFEVVTAGRENEARVIGSTVRWNRCEWNDSRLVAEYQLRIPGGGASGLPFLLAFSPNGIAEARASLAGCPEAEASLSASRMGYDELLSGTLVCTPHELINRGLQWAKVNTARVRHRYRLGLGFTNDPPQDIIVLRDVAWYAFGTDYIMPELSRGLLRLAECSGMHPDGKLTEYIHGSEDPPVLHDYRLNINDDTPLIVLALHHHAAVCEDDAYLRQVYPTMAKACEYILSQISGRLVRCSSEGTNVWGICGWRNIIDGYTLSGAVTEINAECYAALRRTAEAAQHLGLDGPAARYSGAADLLRDAINTELVSENTGLYLLNIGNDGVRHHDVTGDQIFPVLFDVADPPMRKRILDRLTAPDLWTPFGSRTVSRNEPGYDPDAGCQLTGGVWHNLTAWIARCLAEPDPDLLREALVNCYRLSESETPRESGNVVPGEFPERLHGETFESRGMAMSPWMPPTYLWLGVEGLLGVQPSLRGLTMNPVLPSGWKWLAVKDLLYKGMALTAFLFDGRLYSTFPVDSRLPVTLGKPVGTFQDEASVFLIGMKLEQEYVLFAAADRIVTATVGLAPDEVVFSTQVTLMEGESRLFRIPLARQASR